MHLPERLLHLVRVRGTSQGRLKHLHAPRHGLGGAAGGGGDGLAVPPNLGAHLLDGILHLRQPVVNLRAQHLLLQLLRRDVPCGGLLQRAHVLLQPRAR